MKSRVFCLWLAVNMLVAAVLFFPWIKQRETISGFIGRKTWVDTYKHDWMWFAFYYINRLINWVHSDTRHCYDTAIEEQLMREVLYENS